jgi:hypothetical protein
VRGASGWGLAGVDFFLSLFLFVSRQKERGSLLVTKERTKVFVLKTKEKTSKLLFLPQTMKSAFFCKQLIKCSLFLNLPIFQNQNLI